MGASNPYLPLRRNVGVNCVVFQESSAATCLLLADFANKSIEFANCHLFSPRFRQLVKCNKGNRVAKCRPRRRTAVERRRGYLQDGGTPWGIGDLPTSDTPPHLCNMINEDSFSAKTAYNMPKYIA